MTIPRRRTKRKGTPCRKRQRGGKGARAPRCAPGVRGAAFDSTCLSDAHIESMRRAHNARNPSASIAASGRPRAVYDQLLRAERCDAERCLVKSLLREAEDRLAPAQPKEWQKNPNAWLTDKDIRSVMNQHERSTAAFSFYGPSPIDFAERKSNGQCHCKALCNFSSARQINKGKPLVGIVFNLDKHNEPGSHWTCLFLDLNCSAAMYFDSAGDPAPPEVRALVRQMQDTAPPGRPALAFHQNAPFQHQKGDTECGMYCLLFLTTCLQSKSTVSTFQRFKTKRISDADAQKLRDVYFD